MAKDITPEVLLHIKELQDKITKASEDYYNGIESMSNYEYDKLYDELKNLEDEYGIEVRATDNVGAKVQSNGLREVRHEYEAKSLGKTKSVDELIKEQSKTAEGSSGYTCLSWKLDGCTLQLTYDNGRLLSAVTRGDGTVGQDITPNLPYLKIGGVPLEISYKGKLVVRGEALMSYSEFDRLNVNGEFANPRNLASSTLTALDKDILSERHLDFMAFKVVKDGTDYVTRKMEFSSQLDWLRNFGFGVVPHERVQICDLKDRIAEWSKQERIKAFGYPVDGLVVANEAPDTRNLKGTDHHPSKTDSMAFKWEDETAKTVLREIEWSPSRTGLLNPVAVFDTVNLCGTEVSRASLHNVSYIKSLNLKLGDTITVYKANMIIPQIAENLDREKSGVSPLHNLSCPCCNRKATIQVSEKGVETLVCENEKCFAKELGKYTHFVEKQGMNIEGLSENTLLTLMKKGYITSLADIYHLKEHPDIANLQGFGKKSFENLVDAIEKSRDTDFEHFIYACGIDGFGKGQTKVLANYLKENYDGNLKEYRYTDGSFDLLGMLASMSYHAFDFTQISGIGKVLAENLTDFLDDKFSMLFDDSEYAEVAKELNFKDRPLEKGQTNDNIAGKTFVITGTLDNFANREELVAKIESLGGKVSGSVSSKTDYLINNDINSTSGKNKKAHDLNIPIISEKQFLDMTEEKEETEEYDIDKDWERLDDIEREELMHSYDSEREDFER